MLELGLRACNRKSAFTPGAFVVTVTRHRMPRQRKAYNLRLYRFRTPLHQEIRNHTFLWAYTAMGVFHPGVEGPNSRRGHNLYLGIPVPWENRESLRNLSLRHCAPRHILFSVR